MPIVKVEDVISKEFDYIILGGGTSGLALAARLSENPSISVLVLEAGHANMNDANVLVPGQSTKMFGDPLYDWAFSTVKQEHLNGREIAWSRGKSLGGTSTMNFHVWCKSSAFDVNAFERLGNPGWNWAEYLKYTLKVENFHPPTREEQERYPHAYDANLRGHSGPIQTIVSPRFFILDELMQQTFMNKGINKIEDSYGGDITGVWIGSSTFKPASEGWERSYSANGYLEPNLHRQNLNVLTQAFVSRINFEDAVLGEGLTASSVEFLVGDEVYTVKANREVIVSAGAINSPKILEHSGIGRTEILSSIGMDVKVDLPGVGENVQEHFYFTVTYELDFSSEFIKEILDSFSLSKGYCRAGVFTFASIQQCGLAGASSVLSRAEEEVKIAKTKGIPGLAEQLDIWLETLRDDKGPDFEFALIPFFVTGADGSMKCLVEVGALSTHPLSRGNIHAQSNDPKVQPRIDPKYFENETDLNLLVQQFKYIRSLLETEPWKSRVVKETQPGLICTTDDQIRDYIKNDLSTTWHTVGSCSMLPRELNGVVDPQLKVYGTKNVRVVDVSIIPLHVAAHTQTFAYFIGEKAADIIKASLEQEKSRGIFNLTKLVLSFFSMLASKFTRLFREIL